jgi:O-antigen/teichoic acid export membrane protein
VSVPPAEPSLQVRVTRGIGWKAISQVVLQASRVIVALILARLLAPHDYGIAGMVLVFSSLVLVFSDVALGSALVQRRALTELDRSTVFWTSAGVGLAFTVLGVLASWPLAAFFGEPAVQPLVAAMSLSFVVTALGTTQKALMTRELDFRRLELRLMAATLVGAAVGIAAAVGGAGAWAIIGQQLTIALGSTVFLWVSSRWHPRLMFSLQSLRSLAGFSGGIFGTRVLFYVSRNADNLLIGRFLGSSALGAYALAYNLMLMPMERLAAPVQEVLFPAFSRMQDDLARLGAAWLRVNRAVAALSLPVFIALIVATPEFVSVALGAKWDAAIPVLQILAWAGLLQSLQRLNSSVLQARGRAGTLFAFAAVAATLNVVGFIVGLQWGIVGVAAAYAITNTLLQPIYTVLTARTVDLTLRDCVASLSGVLQASAAMLATLVAVKLLLLDLDVPAALRLAALVLAGAASYLPVCAWRAPELTLELRGLIRRPARADPRRPETDPAAVVTLT